MNRRRALLAAGACLPLAARAAGSDDDAAAKLLARLARPPILRASFVQEKHLAALERPLTTRGRLTATREGELIWRIDAPLRLTYVFGRGGMFEIAADGTRRRPGGNSDRVQMEVGKMVAALIGADLDALRRRFDLKLDADPTRWRARLTPRGAPLNAVLVALELEGRAHVERIHVEEVGGDFATIVLLDVQTPAELSAEERALLAAA